MLYPKDIVESVRINNNIVDVISGYVRLEKKGKYYYGLCPFHHEKTPSFTTDPVKQLFYCHGCQKGGDVFKFMMDIENISFTETLQKLASRAHIQLPESNDERLIKRVQQQKKLYAINQEAARFFYKTLISKKGKEGRAYFHNRFIEEPVIIHFGLGFSPNEWEGLHRHLLALEFSVEDQLESGLVLKKKSGGYCDRFRNRVMFPIIDVSGRVIAFGGRVLDESLPKYMNSPESVVFSKGKSLYGLNFAKASKRNNILLVEGYMDLIALHARGIDNVVAPLGTALTEAQGKLIRQYTEEIVVAFDSDTAGRKATLRGMNILDQLGFRVRVLELPSGKDPDEYVQKNGIKAFDKLIDTAKTLVEYRISSLKEKYPGESVEDRLDFLGGSVEILAKIDSEIEREIYAKKIAKQFGISEQSLLSEIDKTLSKDIEQTQIKAGRQPGIYKQQKFEQNIENNVYKNVSQSIKDELFILALLSIDNSLQDIVWEKMPPSEFENDTTKRVALELLDRLRNGLTVNSADLILLLSSEEADQFTAIVVKECHCEDNRKALDLKINEIQYNKCKKKMKSILKQLERNDLTENEKHDLGEQLTSVTNFMRKLRNPLATKNS